MERRTLVTASEVLGLNMRADDVPLPFFDRSWMYLHTVRHATTVAVLSLAIAACGQVEPVLMTLAMPDCSYLGPSSMHSGEAQLTMTRNGIGTWGSSLVRITGEHTFDDLVTHVETISNDWEHRPDWVRPLITLFISDADAADGVDGRAHVGDGVHAVVCLDPDQKGVTTYRVAEDLLVTD